MFNNIWCISFVVLTPNHITNNQIFCFAFMTSGLCGTLLNTLGWSLSFTELTFHLQRRSPHCPVLSPFHLERSRIHCSSACALMKDCGTFWYNHQDRSCHLELSFLEDKGATRRPGNKVESISLSAGIGLDASPLCNSIYNIKLFLG